MTDRNPTIDDFRYGIAGWTHGKSRPWKTEYILKLAVDKINQLEEVIDCLTAETGCARCIECGGIGNVKKMIHMRGNGLDSKGYSCHICVASILQDENLEEDEYETMLRGVADQFVCVQPQNPLFHCWRPSHEQYGEYVQLCKENPQLQPLVEDRFKHLP